MQPALAKVKTLENFLLKHGEDAYISTTLAKMLEYKIRKYGNELAALQQDLRELENKYAMPSAEFFAKFQRGILGDEMDFIEWAALYQMHQALLEKKKALEVES